MLESSEPDALFPHTAVLSCMGCVPCHPSSLGAGEGCTLALGRRAASGCGTKGPCSGGGAAPAQAARVLASRACRSSEARPALRRASTAPAASSSAAANCVLASVCKRPPLSSLQRHPRASSACSPPAELPAASPAGGREVVLTSGEGPPAGAVAGAPAACRLPAAGPGRPTASWPATAPPNAAPSRPESALCPPSPI